MKLWTLTIVFTILLLSPLAMAQEGAPAVDFKPSGGKDVGWKAYADYVGVQLKNSEQHDSRLSNEFGYQVKMNRKGWAEFEVEIKVTKIPERLGKIKSLPTHTMTLWAWDSKDVAVWIITHHMADLQERLLLTTALK